MATYTQIIDLYGIPACGKSTLAVNMAKLASGDMKVTTMQDCIHSARNHKWKFFRSFTLKNILVSINLKFSAPLDKKRRVIPLWKILLMGAYKEYIIRYTDYDIVITDHGDIQRFVSLERGDNLHESEKFRMACLRYLDASLSTMYVYCKINAEEALRRMNGRGRAKGRIDLIENQNEKLQELEKEIKCFDFWSSILMQRGADVKELTMNNEPSILTSQLYSLIQR